MTLTPPNLRKTLKRLSLKHVVLHNCPSLSIGTERLTLKHVVLHNCPSLSIGTERFTLKHAVLHNCPSLSMGTERLTLQTSTGSHLARHWSRVPAPAPAGVLCEIFLHPLLSSFRRFFCTFQTNKSVKVKTIQPPVPQKTPLTLTLPSPTKSNKEK